MFALNQSYKKITNSQYCDPRWIFGVALVALLTFVASELSEIAFFKNAQLSSLTLGILVGIIVGNTVFSRVAKHTAVGVDFSKSTLLKAGIILFGFRITFSQVASVGLHGLVTDILVLISTFLLAIQLGKRLFKLDTQTTILIGAGSSICGAAAIMATEPVIKAQAHKVSVAVATVVVFGTISMFVYPIFFNYMNLSGTGLSEKAYGIFVGSTIHEVAQVVAAGSAVSTNAADIAVIEKMLRVMMLAPFLVVLSCWYAKQNATIDAGKHKECKSNKNAINIPWFALWFIIVSGINSLALIPEEVCEFILKIDNILLTIAMVALGLRTHIGAIKQAGVKPLLLGGCLFIFLTLGGYLINTLVAHFLS
ncbi:YeiH family protein [Colwellia sp. E2M01]|uniref:YeiH family protein n=1 Tax=Colwellia sp. E2M01 TaxID=2841561 RepID=UPI001C0973A6|nr:YeiH family protein [Colwellia sp. E2M01]MBU2871109.1 YeiH family protein [Colwellia sp. E2M01]